MTTKQALEWGEKQARSGHATEEPADSNNTIVWLDYQKITGAPAFQGQPWCGAELIDLIHHSKSGWDAPSDWIGVFAIQAWGEALGRFHRGSDGIEPGDALIIGGPGVHTGMARSSAHADGSVLTIEGNTSPGSEGSQFNGGTVALKQRSAGEVFGYVRIHDVLDGEATIANLVPRQRREPEPQYRPEAETGELHLWEQGPRVEELQDLLGIPSDGYYGPETREALAAYKKKHDHTGGGVRASEKIIEELRARPKPKRAFKELSKGLKGAPVRKLQRLLKKTGAEIEVDGDFGDETESVVNDFKTAHGWKADGRAGPRMWQVLTDQG